MIARTQRRMGLGADSFITIHAFTPLLSFILDVTLDTSSRGLVGSGCVSMSIRGSVWGGRSQEPHRSPLRHDASSFIYLLIWSPPRSGEAESRGSQA